MASFLFLRLTTEAQTSFLAPVGKLFINSETQQVFVGDGVTVGGIQLGLNEADLNQLIGDRFDALNVADVDGLTEALGALVEHSGLDELNTLVINANKADQASLDTLIDAVSTKASVADVDAALAAKADQIEVESLSTQVTDKADNVLFDEQLAAKADQEALDLLQAAASDKAAQDALDFVINQTSSKADTTAVDSQLSGVVGSDELFTSGLIKNELLPAYVDDVLEFSSSTIFPTVGEKGKIYVALDSNKIYRWGGSQYVSVASPELIQIATPEETQALTSNKLYLAPYSLPSLFDTLGFTKNENGGWFVDGGIIAPPKPLTGTFTLKQATPLAVYAGSGGVLNDMLYITTGRAGSGAYPTQLYAYDPSSDQWTTKTPIPRGKYCASSATDGKRLFVCNGRIHTGTLYREMHAYDPVLDRWDTMTPPVQGTDRAALCAVGDKLYLHGGGAVAGGSYIEALRVYDIPSNTWTTPSITGNKPSARGYSAMVAVEGGFYLYGGYSGSQYLRDLWYFDVATLTWSQLPLAPVGTTGSDLVIYNDYLYVIGGATAAGVNAAVLEFDIANQTWRTLAQNPFAVTLAVTGVIGDGVYQSGGTADGVLTGVRATTFELT